MSRSLPGELLACREEGGGGEVTAAHSPQAGCEPEGELWS